MDAFALRSHILMPQTTTNFYLLQQSHIWQCYARLWNILIRKLQLMQRPRNWGKFSIHLMQPICIAVISCVASSQSWFLAPGNEFGRLSSLKVNTMPAERPTYCFRGWRWLLSLGSVFGTAQLFRPWLGRPWILRWQDWSCSHVACQQAIIFWMCCSIFSFHNNGVQFL